MFPPRCMPRFLARTGFSNPTHYVLLVDLHRFLFRPLTYHPSFRNLPHCSSTFTVFFRQLTGRAPALSLTEMVCLQYHSSKSRVRTPELWSGGGDSLSHRLDSPTTPACGSKTLFTVVVVHRVTTECLQMAPLLIAAVLVVLYVVVAVASLLVGRCFG